MPEYAKTQAQTVAAATGQAAATVEEQLKASDPMPVQAGQLKKFLPYVLGAIAIGLVAWILSKNQ